MKRLLIPILTIFTLMAHAANPLFTEFDTPRQTPPFDRLDDSMWMPAIDRGIELARAEIRAIASDPEAPTFENTIVALDRAGRDLDRVLNVFFPLLSAEASDRMMEISMEASPKLADYSTSIVLNEPLWNRVRTVYEGRDKLDLTPEQKTLLQNTYDSFALAGANLRGEDREKFRSLSAELSELTTRFGQNVLKEMSTYEIWLTEADLAGLPASSVEAAAEAAKAKGREGEFLFTLDAPVYMSFMKYSARPDLREKMWRLNSARNTKGEYDNMEIMSRIADVRRETAALLGSPDYATHSLKQTMAKDPAAVYDLLDRLREAYTPAMRREMQELTDFASRMEGRPVTVNPWDYSYYSNKLKAEKYAFDEEALRPYFELDNVISGVFGLATRLYGLQFKENPAIPVYHPDVKAFDVTDADGSDIGVIFTDFFPRATKRPGAWMTEFRAQHTDADGRDVRPQVTIVMNFTKPTASAPSLLTPYEVETFLHEFGHALHGLLSKANYSSLSGTSVRRDFVELPSQFNENYLTEKEFLDGFARHYLTGEPIPAELIGRLVSAQQYGAAYACVRQLMFGYLDMAWHTTHEHVADPAAFEAEATKSVQIFPAQAGALVSPQFSHIFAGGYAAGYYSYKWAEVLDADAFAKFKENGIFDRATADSFRHNILEKGGTEAPDELYRRFRGQEPTIDALLERDGIRRRPEPEVARPAKD